MRGSRGASRIAAELRPIAGLNRSDQQARHDEQSEVKSTVHPFPLCVIDWIVKTLDHSRHEDSADAGENSNIFFL